MVRVSGASAVRRRSATAGGGRHLLRKQADAFRDWGAGGKDDTFGWGGATLLEYHADTVWLDETYSTAWVPGSPSPSTPIQGPVQLFDDALDLCADGDRIVLIDHEEPGDWWVTKDVILDSIGGTSDLGN